MIPRLIQRGLRVSSLQFRMLSSERKKSTTDCHEAQENTDSQAHEREMKNFSRMSADWWDPNGPTKVLHSMNSLRIPLIRTGLANTGRIPCDAECAADPLKGVKILDVGCGGGILSIPLGRLGGEVTGIDPNKDLVMTAQERLKVEEGLKVQFRDEGLEDHLKGSREAYDAVVLSEVIEHVCDQEGFLHKCVECIKPGGSIFVTTFNKTPASWALGIVLAEYVFGLIPKGTHSYEKFIAPDTVKAYLSKVNCETVLVNGMAYVPVQNKWHWCPSTLINYALHGVKLKAKP